MFFLSLSLEKAVLLSDLLYICKKYVDLKFKWAFRKVCNVNWLHCLIEKRRLIYIYRLCVAFSPHSCRYHPVIYTLPETEGVQYYY